MPLVLPPLFRRQSAAANRLALLIDDRECVHFSEIRAIDAQPAWTPFFGTTYDLTIFLKDSERHISVHNVDPDSSEKVLTLIASNYPRVRLRRLPYLLSGKRLFVPDYLVSRNIAILIVTLTLLFFVLRTLFSLQ